MANKAKHAFGSSDSIGSALERGVINVRDILFLDEDTDKPKIGWIAKDGNPVILTDEKADLSEIESSVEALGTEVATKADAEEVAAKFATKADVTDVTKLEEVVSTKVDAEAVQTMIEEHSIAAIEIIEF